MQHAVHCLLQVQREQAVILGQVCVGDRYRHVVAGGAGCGRRPAPFFASGPSQAHHTNGIARPYGGEVVPDGAGQLPRAAPAAVPAPPERAAALGASFDLGGGSVRDRPLSELCSAAVLTALVDDHAHRLRTDERRVAASILYQGLAARFWSPVIGCAADGVLLDLDELRWSQGPRLHLPQPRGWLLADPSRHATLVADVVLGRLLPLARALRSVVRVAEGLLRGNAASALMGTVVVTELGGRSGARDLAYALSELPVLHGTGSTGPDGAFRRASCCLYYRVPGGGLCGDCPLPAMPSARPPVS